MFGPRFLLSFALAGLCNVQIASANEISYSEDLSDFGPPKIAGEFDFSLPKFSPDNGILSNVVISFSSSASGASGPPGGGGWQFGFTITGPGIPPRPPGTFDSLSDIVFLGSSTGPWSSPLAGGVTVIPTSTNGYIGDGLVSLPVEYSEFGLGATNCAASPSCARTLNATLGITYQFVPYAGTPGAANCVGTSISALSKKFGGLNAAAAAVGVADIQALQNAISTFCAR
jgi:hypothetical protein